MASVFDVDNFGPVSRNSSSKILSSSSFGQLSFSNSDTAAAIMRLGYDVVAPAQCAPNGCIAEDVGLVTTKTTLNSFADRTSSYSAISFAKRQQQHQQQQHQALASLYAERHLVVDVDMECDRHADDDDDSWEQEEPLDFSCKSKNSNLTKSSTPPLPFSRSPVSTKSSPNNHLSTLLSGKENGGDVTPASVTITSRDLIRSKLESKLSEMREMTALKHHAEWNGHGHPKGTTATSDGVNSKINGSSHCLPELLRVKPTNNATSIAFPRHLGSPNNGGNNDHGENFGSVLGHRDGNGLQRTFDRPRHISAFNRLVSHEEDHNHVLDSGSSLRQRPTLMTSLSLLNSGVAATSSARSPLIDTYDKSLLAVADDILSKPTAPPVVSRTFKNYSSDHLLPLTYYALSSNLQLPFLSSPTGASELLNRGSRNSMVDQTVLSNDSYEDFKRQIKQLQQRHLDCNSKRLDFGKRSVIGGAPMTVGQEQLLNDSSSPVIDSRRPSLNPGHHPSKRSTSSSSPLSSPSSYVRETAEERSDSISSPERGTSRLLPPVTELSNGTTAMDPLLSNSPSHQVVNSSSSPVSATSRSSSPIMERRGGGIGGHQRPSVAVTLSHSTTPMSPQEGVMTPSERLVSTSSVNCPSPSSQSSSMTSSSPNGVSNSRCGDNLKSEMSLNLNASGSVTNLIDSRRNSRDVVNNKKRGRSLPDELKDEAYWERRRKNNEAAKRSRDARRAKEDEIAIRAAFLEQENLKLRVEVAALKSETAKLRCLLYNS